MYLKENLASSTLPFLHSTLFVWGVLGLLFYSCFASIFFVPSGDLGRPTVEIICKEYIMVWVSKNILQTVNERNLPENGLGTMYLYAL